MTDETTRPPDHQEPIDGTAYASDEFRVLRKETIAVSRALDDDDRRDLDVRIGEKGLARREAVIAEEEAKSAYQSKKKAREKLDDEIASLAEEIGDGTKTREVPCEVVAYWRLNAVRWMSEETGEIVQERALTPEERQEELRLAAPPPDNVVPFQGPEEGQGQELRPVQEHITGAAENEMGGEVRGPCPKGCTEHPAHISHYNGTMMPTEPVRVEVSRSDARNGDEEEDPSPEQMAEDHEEAIEEQEPEPPAADRDTEYQAAAPEPEHSWRATRIEDATTGEVKYIEPEPDPLLRDPPQPR